MSAHSGIGVGAGTAAGAALLALWILVRYPNLGLRSLRVSVGLCAVAVVVCHSAGTVIPYVANAADSLVAILAVAVPVLVFAFWSAGLLMKSFMSALPGR